MIVAIQKDCDLSENRQVPMTLRLDNVYREGPRRKTTSSLSRRSSLRVSRHGWPWCRMGPAPRLGPAIPSLERIAALPRPARSTPEPCNVAVETLRVSIPPACPSCLSTCHRSMAWITTGCSLFDQRNGNPNLLEPSLLTTRPRNTGFGPVASASWERRMRPIVAAAVGD